jgi:predicted DNA-binding transcriptional regulator AlpA
MGLRVLFFADLREKKGIRFTRQHVDRLRKLPPDDLRKFPDPLKLGPGDQALNAWLEEEIDAYILRCAAARKPAPVSNSGTDR